LRKIFEEGSRKAPSIIFLDEIDAIAPRREQVVGEVEKRVVAQLLALMDGLAKRRKVIVIAATNLPNVLDPALRRPGRFDEVVEIPLPDESGRCEIFTIHLQDKPVGVGISSKNLASRTDGFSGADISSVCTRAARRAVRRAVLAGEEAPAGQARVTIEASDLEAALEEIRQ
jgi:transitional endoplasmic reticulum ATPase